MSAATARSPEDAAWALALFLTQVGAYWIAVALALLFFALRRRPGVLNTLLSMAIFWLVLWGLGTLIGLFIPCLAADTAAALGLMVAIVLSLILPLRLWQRLIPLALVALTAATRCVALGCRVPGDLALGLGVPALVLAVLWLLGRWPASREVWRRASLALDNWLTPQLRLPLTPSVVAVLAARLRQHLGFALEGLQPVDAEGVHASTPLILSGRDREGRPRRLFAKIVGLRNWQTSTAHQVLRWLQHGGRLQVGPLRPTLKALVEHEQHMLLLFAEAGVPVPRTWGVYRLQRRAYALVSDYLEGARSLRGLGQVSDAYVTQAFAALQRMRQADLAHRDLKASNLVVLPGERFALVDLALAESVAGQRRLARDLADMLVALAMHHDPAGVVRIAGEAVGLRALGQARRFLHVGEVNTETARMVPPELLPRLRELVAREAEAARP